MIQVWSETTTDYADSKMPQEILTRLGSHISVHPWWHARARLVKKIIRLHFGLQLQKILDVGCGWGVTLKHLEAVGHDVWGLDIGHESLKLLDGPGRQLIQADIENGMIPDEMNGNFDCVMALDVLEHLDYPEEAVRNMIQLTRRGGLIIITVPAMMELWSEFDEIQAHRKRYAKHEVLELLEKMDDLKEIQLGYCWPWLVSVARWTRKKNIIQNKNVAEMDKWKTYEKYVKPGPWFYRYLLDRAFRLSENQTLRGKASYGTTILAVAIRK